MSHLANFVRVCNSKDVGIDRTRADKSYTNVVLKHFSCKAVEIALSTSHHCIIVSKIITFKLLLQIVNVFQHQQ